MAKVILYRLPGERPMMLVVTGLEIDTATKQFVSLQEEVVGEDGEMTRTVPVSSCLEFDSELLEEVNYLVTTACQFLDAAHKILDAKGIPLEVPETDPELQVTLH